MNERAWTCSAVVFAAATFNMGLCFLNTHGVPIGPSQVIACEIIILAAAAVLSYRVITPEASILGAVLAAYFCAIWLVTGVLDAKVVRDLLIPLVFISAGAACAERRDADRLVYGLTLLVLAVAIIEWLWLARFLKIFDILGYFLAKGRIEESQKWMDLELALNGMRPESEGRTLFPGLGLHRVSSIFLEPVSTGNFAVIAFAWLLVRFKAAPLKNLVYLALVGIILVLADSRLAAVTCLVLVAVRLAHPLPAAALWALPFISVAGLVSYATMFPLQETDQSFVGRLVGSGQLLASFDIADWFGIGDRWVQSSIGLRSTLDNLDSGYAYAVYAVGLPGLIVLWTAFAFARNQSIDAARYRTLLALYICLAFFVSQSVFSIKTAALAWFLLGASQNAPAIARRAAAVSMMQAPAASLYLER